MASGGIEKHKRWISLMGMNSKYKMVVIPTIALAMKPVTMVVVAIFEWIILAMEPLAIVI